MLWIVRERCCPGDLCPRSCSTLGAKQCTAHRLRAALPLTLFSAWAEELEESLTKWPLCGPALAKACVAQDEEELHK